MKIMSKSRIRHLVRLQRKLKLKKKAKIKSKIYRISHTQLYILLDYNSSYMFRPSCSWNCNLIKYKALYDCIIYILCHILAYIQHKRDVSLEKKIEKEKHLHSLSFSLYI